jgi:predicted Zn-dependent peptidase
MQYDYRQTRLPNGARIASIEMPHMQSVSVGFWAGVGGRYENQQNTGISHFVEHLLFKGTRNRSARTIIESVEGVGGYLNAFTTEDHTCYYAKAGHRHLPELCDVLADMYLHSSFAQNDIEKEREVIREEILMYRDHPAQHAQELLSQTMWPGHPLGRPLTGTVETISRFRRPELRQFVRENYNGATTVITVAGRAKHSDVLEALAPALSKLDRGRNPRYARSKVFPDRSRVSLATQETEQTQLALGFYAFGRNDERRFALKLLSVILGENMSSRLFQRLREDHGFCYSISSGMVTLADSGLLNIFAGLDTGKFDRAVKLIFKELERLCAKAPSRQELQKAKDYAIGQTLMGLESTTNQMMWMGESILGYGKVLNPAEIQARLMDVTPEQVRAVACHCLNRVRLGIAVVGPLKDVSRIESCIV